MLDSPVVTTNGTQSCFCSGSTWSITAVMRPASPLDAAAALVVAAEFSSLGGEVASGGVLVAAVFDIGGAALHLPEDSYRMPDRVGEPVRPAMTPGMWADTELTGTLVEQPILATLLDLGDCGDDCVYCNGPETD
jgi:hypothetical protein